MGRGRSGRGSSRGKGKGDAAEKSSRYINRVDLYKFLCKWELRSYPDNHGRPLFDSPAHLSTEHLRTILDGDCSELLRRPLMGLNLSSASIDSAALFAPRLTASLAQIQALLEKESLNEAVRYFNLNRDVERDSTASRDMCKVYFKQVQKAMRDHGPLLAEAAEAAAAVYTGLMALLELAAVTEDIRWWASKVPEVKKQAKHIQAWLAHPKDEDKLFHALAHGIKADEKKNLRRERSFGQLDAEAARSSSSVPLSGDGSDSLSTDSTSTMSGKKKKKSRRAQKRSVDHKRKKHGKKEKSRKSRDAGGSKAKRTRRSAKKSSSADSSPSGKDGRKMKKLDHGSDTTSVECATAAPPLQEIWPLAEFKPLRARRKKSQLRQTALSLPCRRDSGCSNACLSMCRPLSCSAPDCSRRQETQCCRPMLPTSQNTSQRWFAKRAWPGRRRRSTKTRARGRAMWCCCLKTTSSSACRLHPCRSQSEPNGALCGLRPRTM